LSPPARPSTGFAGWSRFLKLTLLLHALLLPALVLLPEQWPWWLALLVANHVLIMLGGLWPRAGWLGPNLTRLPPAAAARGEVALTLDDGPDPEVTPQVLALLSRHEVRVTFFCIARKAEAHPALVAEILAQGHSVQNHSHRHWHTFSLLGPTGFAAEVGRAQQVLAGLCGGEAPRFFRAPAGLRNPFLQPVLARLGLQLTSWTRRGFDTRERDPQRVLARLTRGLAGGDILLLHDGHAARDAAGVPVLLQVLPALLDQIRRAGLRCVTLPEAMAGPLPGSSVFVPLAAAS
jgi:peptidoglycan/xylan/chitin deacetylase (PgdA/CDA1 family)